MKYAIQRVLVFAVILTALIPASALAVPINDTGSGFIVVTNPPVADFYTSTRYGPGPFTVSFSDNSLGALPMTYRWDFGDSTSSSRQNPSHTYAASGEYTVRLTVTNEYGTNTKTVPAYIGVGLPPEAEFKVTPGSGEIPLIVSFTDVSINRPGTWNWDFGDGTTSSEQNPVHTYTAPGSYSVTLRVTNHFGSDRHTISGVIIAGNPAPVQPPAPVIPEKKKPEGLAGLIQEARGSTEKNLPTGNFIPPQFMALAAVITSMGVILVQILIANLSTLSQIGFKIAKFLADLAGGHAVEKLSEKEIEARKLAVRKMERHFLGLSATEVLVIEAAVIMVALAFILADRAELTLETVLIYIAVGAISIVLHDFAHRYFATKHGHDADTQFWGLGTVIMFLTAWLYGNAFAQSYRNLVNRETEDEPREMGIEMVAGPVVSIILMVIFLLMVMFGGLWAVAGGIGFTINLITAVYSLMPIETMDGGAVWRWNRGLYLALFVPIIIFYFYTFMLV
ncbi:PKD domain-containing protein [uncultured Methanoregula sp.]|uniref:PKD domain-containing protein n=1 Tax=uncultured Methanoregula sp. TaxID=1005933 RepID=UPI002AAB23D9|nr:PKD domain-containing protein [uncultured Methanoregula sp.]